MFDSVLEAVVFTLNNEGIPAVRKYPDCILDRDATSVAVSLKSGSLTVSGYGNYLGICDFGGEVREVYGSRADLKIGLEIYTPAAAEHAEPECTALLGDICGCVANIGGMKLRSFENSEPEYDADTEMFCCKSVLNLTAYLVRSAGENGEFTDFVLRGELK